MSYMHEELPTIKPHILFVLNSDSKVMAFDKERNRTLLPQGQYEFLYVQNPMPNPHSSATQVLQLVSFKEGQWYVSQHFLDSLDKNFWSVELTDS